MEKQKPLISIITVSFNSVKTIEKTILSVLNQTYNNIEYIIIDGGSTDGTVDIIKKYSDKIKYWISEKDNGISDAFNKGIMASHGEIIGIINSDDWYEIDAIESIIKLDEENNADVYVGSLRYWKDEKENTVLYPDTKYKKTISFRMPHLNHPSSFFKKQTYNDIGLFDIKYKYAMDYDIFLKVFLKNKHIYLTKKILANMLSGGFSNTHKNEAYREVYLISKNKILGYIWYSLSLLRIKIKSFI
jgi:glycosyltransferase involved in cell wall biosynthesis